MHTYAATTGQVSCSPCPSGRYCAGNTSNPTLCPLRFFCPVGPPILCPNGTYGAQVGTQLLAPIRIRSRVDIYMMISPIILSVYVDGTLPRLSMRSVSRRILLY
jgi:hypothetical protein